MTTPSKPRTPPKLGRNGRALWLAVVGEYELRVDELRVLEHAARTLDLIDDMAAALAEGDIMIAGSMGQARPHPLLTEIRGHRTLLATLLKQLGLPDDSAPNASRRGQSAAASRWGRGA